MVCLSSSNFFKVVSTNSTWYILEHSVPKETCSPLVSSHLPNTELAAANTEQREFNVVVIPACKKHMAEKKKDFSTK